MSIFDQLGQLKERSYWKPSRIIMLLLALTMILFVALDIARHCNKPEGQKASTSANFERADYSSDRNWLGCRHHQHDCVYDGIGESLSPIHLEEKCGHRYICDDLFQSSTPGSTMNNNRITVRGGR